MSEAPGDQIRPPAVWFRHGDPRFPFLWETAPQPPARWHGSGDGPVTYLADTPDGAWAEFLRHEAITDPADLAGISRRIWAVEVSGGVLSAAVSVALPHSVCAGGPSTYPACQAHAKALRRAGAQVLLAPSAALLPGAASGQQTRGGLVEAPARDGAVLVLCGGTWPDVRAWAAVDVGAPTERQLRLVRHM